MTNTSDPAHASFGPHGIDSLAVPVFRVLSDTATELLRWKSEHPDWFEAGQWDGGSLGAGDAAATRHQPPARVPAPGSDPREDYAAIIAPVALPEASALSVRAFKQAAALTP